MNILIVDDEKLLVKGLKSSLMQEGFNVYTAYDGKEALELLNREKVDFIILDIMLPEIDGITLCKRIRQSMDTPVIMLTAKDDHIDKILGLEMGADDYMTKPFNVKELIARIRTVCRRMNGVKKVESVMELGNLRIDFLGRSFYKEGREIALTAKEFDILKILVTNRGMVFSKDRLFELAWNEPGYDTRTVDVHISNLREKIEDDPAKPSYIITKWGVGYYFRKERV